jgi:multidrug transporter EmrE-like cation transporter
MNYIGPVVITEAIGDWSFTKYVQGNRKNPFYRLFGYICYIGVLEFFQKTIELKGLTWANSAWDGWSNLITFLIAFLLFGERPSMQAFFGIILISLGLFFIGTDAVATYGNITNK